MKQSNTRGKRYSVRVLLPKMRAQAEKDRSIREAREQGRIRAEERRLKREQRQTPIEADPTIIQETTDAPSTPATTQNEPQPTVQPQGGA